MEDRKGEAIDVIRRGLAEGKDWDEIAEDIREKLGVNATPEMVKYFWSKYAADDERLAVVGSSGSSSEGEEDVSVGDINEELDYVYREAKKRVLVYRRLEQMFNMPIPDTDRALKTLIDILKIKVEMGKTEQAKSWEEVIKKVLE